MTDKDDFIGPDWATRTYNAAASPIEEPTALRLGHRIEGALDRAHKRERRAHIQAVLLVQAGMALIALAIYLAFGIVPTLVFVGTDLICTAIMQSPRRKR